jgi:DNA-binding LytR/AlgR family response regulator
MEDHYVRVHTPHGSALLLMRMRDAVAELDGLPGALVHRSWWVAQGAVQGVRREGRNVRLQLAGGIEAPVARAQIAPLEAAGWL